MVIKKLPQYLINKIKAWEIIERPYSVVKELMENSLDAWADEIIVFIKNWWKTNIKIEDNWTWIDISDLEMTVERYATSKISEENDLQNISSYGFRGEALASISEISKFKIQTKTSKEEIWYELLKISDQLIINKIPFHKNSWTIVYVDDLFFNTPVRKKFLKKDNTEWNYIYSTFIDFALSNHEKSFTLIKDDKVCLKLTKSDSLLNRILDIYKKWWESNLKIVENGDKDLKIYWLISDASLTFNTPNNIKIYVNKRPVIDKILKKSILSSYDRQIPYWEYPFVVLFLEIDSKLIDVNVHPKKEEIRFLDPGSVFNFVKQSISKTFQDNQINYSTLNSSTKKPFQKNYTSSNTNSLKNTIFDQTSQLNFEFEDNIWYKNTINNEVENKILDYQIIWQIFDSYIVFQNNNEIFFADQHALAERIKFEKMKKDKKNTSPEILLTPIICEVIKNIDLEKKIEELWWIGFDVSKFWDNKLIFYSVPKFLVDYKVDLNKLLDNIILMDQVTMDIMIDRVFATKACKVSIKAWQVLSMEEMRNLIKDGFENIEGMFSCQHWRPSIVKMKKEDINKLFDRN